MSGSMYKNVMITDISEEGNGIGRHDGKVVFVRDALPGEIVNVRITRSKKKYDQGEVVSYVKRSDRRGKPFCMHYGVCGGCSLQHVGYEDGLDFKANWVRSSFSKIGKLDIGLPSVVGMNNRWKYRNKVVFHGFFMDGEYRLGFYRKGSNSFVPIRECLLVPDVFVEIKDRIEEFAGIYNVYPDEIMLRTNGSDLQINLECGDSDNLDLLLCALRDEFSSFVDVIEFSVSGCVFGVSSNSFFQVNLEGAAALLGIVSRFVGDVSSSTIYDLCCGVGLFGVCLGKAGAKVRGYEVVGDAVTMANKNAERNGLTDFSFEEGRVEDVISSSVFGDGAVVILDPPRGGVEQGVVDALINSSVDCIIYVGCGLGKMVRDVSRLVEGGFSISDVGCVDMFPWTGHVETITKLIRVKS